ncbi:hypothetical protein NT05LM_3326, partial [Listeria marthii FSL S4-120]
PCPPTSAKASKIALISSKPFSLRSSMKSPIQPS